MRSICTVDSFPLIEFGFFVVNDLLFCTYSNILRLFALEGGHVLWSSVRGSSCDLGPFVSIRENNTSVFVLSQELVWASLRRKVNELKNRKRWVSKKVGANTIFQHRT